MCWKADTFTGTEAMIMKMTKAEISAKMERIAAKIARGEISARPLSADQKRRIEQIIKREERNSPPRRSALRA
jgi:hypothetical protein